MLLLSRPGFFVAVLAWSAPADASCRLPPDPTVFCGLGTSVIRGTVLPRDGDVDIRVPPTLRVVVTSVAGSAIDGVAVGAEVTLVDDGSGSDALRPPSEGDAVFILQDAGTYVLGAPVSRQNTVLIVPEGEASLPVEYVLASAVDPDVARCADVAWEVVEPPMRRGSAVPCDDEPGCAATGAGNGLSLLSLLAALRLVRRGRQTGSTVVLSKGVR